MADDDYFFWHCCWNLMDFQPNLWKPRDSLYRGYFQYFYERFKLLVFGQDCFKNA